jgi:hypothetical protein
MIANIIVSSTIMVKWALPSWLSVLQHLLLAVRHTNHISWCARML